MKLTKESWLSILRIAITSVGAYFIGKSFLGATIDNDLWLGIGASVVTAATIIWGIVDKTVTTEMLQSGLRSIVLTFGVLLVGSGVITDGVLQGLLAIITVIFAAGSSEAEKRKNRNVAIGATPIKDLSGVDPVKTPVNPDTVTTTKAA